MEGLTNDQIEETLTSADGDGISTGTSAIGQDGRLRSGSSGLDGEKESSFEEGGGILSDGRSDGSTPIQNATNTNNR